MHFSVFFKISVLLLAAVAGTPALAGWYTAQGTAAITGSVAAARDEAVNNAVRSVMMQTGAAVNMEETFRNGVMVDSKMRLTGSLPIRRINVIEEQKTSDRVTVIIKVLVDERGIKTCVGSSLRKSVLPLRMRFVDQNAYTAGAGIDALSEELGDLIYSRLSENPSLNVRPQFYANIRGAGSGNAPDIELRDNIFNIGRQTQSQFLISGLINSIAASDTGSNMLTQLFMARTRSIDFSIDIYDAATGDKVFSQRYSAEADWPFKQGDFIDVRSESFRGSSYGMRVRELAERASTDIVQSLQCRAPSARIIEIDNDDFLIDAGADVGIRPGMLFRINHRFEGTGYAGFDYPREEPAAGTYKVVEVYAHSSRLRSRSLNDNLLNLRLNDTVSVIREPRLEPEKKAAKSADKNAKSANKKKDSSL